MTSDKSYAVEQRLTTFITAMGGLAAHGYQTAYLMSNAAQCNSASQTSVGLSVQINQTGVQYFWEVDCYIAAQSTLPIYITMGGPTTSSFDTLIAYGALFNFAANDAMGYTARQTAIGVNTGLQLATVVNGNGYWVHLQGQGVFTATGNLQVAQATSTGSPAFTVQQGSRMRVFAG